MAKNKKEEVAEVATEQPKLDDKVEKLKIKEKPSIKKFSNNVDEVTKVDLSKPLKTKEDAVSERKTEEVDVEKQAGDGEKMDGEEPVVQEIKEDTIKEEGTVQDEEQPVIEEITSEETKEKVEEITEQVKEAVVEAKTTGKPIPENIQKLMQFMDETGGDLKDYVNLNKDYSEMDNDSLLREYYKQTKPHLDSEEIEFLMEDQFAFDEELDERKEVKRKKLALKEQVASAKSHLDGLKSKHYEDIKAGSKLTSEQQKAMDFFNRYNEESKEEEQRQETFNKKTNQLFNDKFKGFEYNVGEKKFRFNVKDVNKTKDNQSDINNFVNKFSDKDKNISDTKGYHKSMFTAMNADAIANHFYEQGRADALKNSVAKSKNISMDPRQQHGGEINTDGIKVRVLGDDSNDFKFKIKNK